MASDLASDKFKIIVTLRRVKKFWKYRTIQKFNSSTFPISGRDFLSISGVPILGMLNTNALPIGMMS